MTQNLMEAVSSAENLNRERAVPNDWFDNLGLVQMAGHHAALNRVGNRRDT
ncbi:hypothetical protein [Rhodopila sp.]|uniref:hypothetical protein n=1 Tax=Rhodopila sp. TaxID=2480087 RepID=UPI003D119673